jgi:hypothetical protein
MELLCCGFRDRSMKPDTQSVALRLDDGVVTLGGVGFVSALANDSVERVLCGSGAGFVCGAGDVSLRCRHRLVT